VICHDHKSVSEDSILDLLDKRLRERLEVMINCNMERLLQALYRIDVDQSMVDEAFSLGEIKKVCEKLSWLIINRQLKKLEYAKSHTGE
jgi:hypothetical protein